MDTFLKVLGSLFLLGLMAAGGCVACGGFVAYQATEGDRNPTVTLQEFNRLKNGMSYNEVVQIIGAHGEVMSENEIAGVRTVLYTWTNGISNMNAMFQDDKMIQKAQLGLQ